MATTTQTSGWSISYQLVFCGGPHLLCLSLSPSSLCLSLSLAITRKHTYTLTSSLCLLPSSSVTHSAMSLPRSFTCSLEPHPHLYSFRLRLTTSIRALRFSSFPPKERTDFGSRHGESLLNSCDMISFGHFGIRFYNLLRYMEYIWVIFRVHI